MSRDDWVEVECGIVRLEPGAILVQVNGEPEWVGRNVLKHGGDYSRDDESITVRRWVAEDNEWEYDEAALC